MSPPLHGRGRGWSETPPLRHTRKPPRKPTCELFATHTVAIIVTYTITRDWRVAPAVRLIEPAVQTAAFLIHDRIWSGIDAKRSV
ncbi:MAG: DUF2061 domain-containing protein [Terricaulis sp.]